jgi:lipopolysaccharide export system permease protein
VHIRDRAPNGELLGLLLHDARDPKQIVTYLAERGLIIKQSGAAYLRMQKGHIIRRVSDQPAPQIIVFDAYAVDLNQLERRVDQAQFLRPRERYTAELQNPDPNDPSYRESPGRFISELHERFASPLYAFAFVLLALAFLGHAQTTRQSRMQAVIAAFAAAVGARIMGVAAANTVAIRPQAAAMLYAIPVGFGLVAAVAVYWRMYPRRPTRLSRAVSRMVQSSKMIVASVWPGREVPAGAARRS